MKRIINWVRIILLLISIIIPLSCMTVTQTEVTDGELKSILQDRIDRAKQSVGIVVGLVDEKGIRTISYGKLSQNNNQTLNGDSVFEIGSITKVFTAILLADMVERGEVNLNDPISKYLPKLVKTPTHDDKEITLLHLSSQISSLPRLPNNMTPKDKQNPYADYTVEQMYNFLSNYSLTRDIGAKYEYSNFGVGLLGHILALRAGTDYETLVYTRISQVLKMDNTRIKLTPKMQAHLAKGYNWMLRPVANWDIPTLAGAGALRSTVNDLLKFITANLGLSKSQLLTAMQKTHQSQHDTNIPNVDIGLGWHILKKFDTEIVWHNGGTGGYRSFIGFVKNKHKGVVVLSNAANNIDDIGLHLLNSRHPLAKIKTPKVRKAVKLDPNILDVYVGEYQLAPKFILKFSREGDKFFIQATGQDKYEIFAETENEFFMEVVDAQGTFIKDDQGQVMELVWHQNGTNRSAKKIK